MKTDIITDLLLQRLPSSRKDSKNLKEDEWVEYIKHCFMAPFSKTLLFQEEIVCPPPPPDPLDPLDSCSENPSEKEDIFAFVYRSSERRNMLRLYSNKNSRCFLLSPKEDRPSDWFLSMRLHLPSVLADIDQGLIPEGLFDAFNNSLCYKPRQLSSRDIKVNSTVAKQLMEQQPLCSKTSM